MIFSIWMWKNWSTAYCMCEFCHWHIHWKISSPKYTESEIPLFVSEYDLKFSSVFLPVLSTCFWVYIVFLIIVSAWFIWRIQFVVWFCWDYSHSDWLHWGVDFEELLWREKNRRFSCELCRYCWAQLTWWTTSQTLVFSTYKKTDRAAASHMVPLEEIMTQEVTSYFGFLLIYCIESFFDRVLKQLFFFF